MKIKHALLAASAMLSTGVMAQDVVVMRRTVAPPKLNEAPSKAVGTWKLGEAVVTPGCSDRSPTAAPVTCVATDGRLLPDANCQAAKPSGSGTAANYSQCTYKWITGVYGDPSPSCSSTAVRTRSVSCQRQDQALTIVDASLCDAASVDARTTDEPTAYYGGCGYVAGGFTRGVPSSTCSTKASRTDVATTCTRSGVGVPTVATLEDCRNAGVETTRIFASYDESSSCTYTPTYSPTYSACIQGKQTAQITGCKRSDGTSASLDKCGAQTTERTCTTGLVTCDTPKVAFTLADIPRTGYYTAFKIPTFEAAKSACEAFSKTVRFCYIDTSSDGYYALGSPSGTITPFPNNNRVFTSACYAN